MGSPELQQFTLGYIVFAFINLNNVVMLDAAARQLVSKRGLY